VHFGLMVDCRGDDGGDDRQYADRSRGGCAYSPYSRPRGQGPGHGLVGAAHLLYGFAGLLYFSGAGDPIPAVDALNPPPTHAHRTGRPLPLQPVTASPILHKKTALLGRFFRTDTSKLLNSTCHGSACISCRFRRGTDRCAPP